MLQDNTIEEENVIDLENWYQKLSKLTDQRSKRGVRYPLPILVTMIILAKMSGEDEPRGIADWLRHRRGKICQMLGFWRETTPDKTTISRALGKMLSEKEVDELVAEILLEKKKTSKTKVSEEEPKVIIALDGKTLRGTIPAGKTQGYHLLSAYLPQEGIVLAQLPVDQKENEIVVAPQLLEMVDIKGKVVTSDALNTQQKLAQQIIDSGGDYLFLVKGNQPKTQAAIEKLFTPPTMRPGFRAVPTDFRTVTQVDLGHGRLETRTLTASSMLNDFLDWPALAQVFRLNRRFVHMKTGEIERQEVYGITSLPPADASPNELLLINRQYWGIENGLHRSRDVTFREDFSLLHLPKAQHVMASLNNFILGLIKLVKSSQQTIPDMRRFFNARPDSALALLSQFV